jgi:hypothetical protein
MDEEEKPFPIEFIVILLLIAIVNDIAEVFFDLLDFTGVGIDGVAIMGPVNFILDFFFTGIFIWRVGFGGGTITQYIGDLFEPLFIPGRTISVGLGMWIANHPNSAIGKAVSTAAALESGGVGGVPGETESAVSTVEKEAAGAEKKIQSEAGGATNEGSAGESRAISEAAGAEKKSSDGKGDGEGKENTPEDDVFKNPYDNPVGTAGEELNTPPEEEFHEGKEFEKAETEEEEEPKKKKIQPQKVIDIASRRPPSPQKDESADNTTYEDLAEAA